MANRPIPSLHVCLFSDPLPSPTFWYQYRICAILFWPKKVDEFHVPFQNRNPVSWTFSEQFWSFQKVSPQWSRDSKTCQFHVLQMMSLHQDGQRKTSSSSVNMPITPWKKNQGFFHSPFQPFLMPWLMTGQKPIKGEVFNEKHWKGQHLDHLDPYVIGRVDYYYPPRERIHIPPNGKFGKSSTQTCHSWGICISFVEGIQGGAPIYSTDFGVKQWPQSPSYPVSIFGHGK